MGRKIAIFIFISVFVAALTGRPLYEDYKRGSIDPEPHLIFLMDNEKEILTLDNTRAKSDATNIRIQGISFQLNPRTSAILNRDQIAAFGGNLMYISPNVKAGNSLKIDLTDPKTIEPLLHFEDVIGPEPLSNVNMPKISEAFSNYYCLRLLFVNQGTGREYAHYMIVDKYKNFHNGCVSPELFSASGTRKPQTQDPIFAVCDAMKAAARTWYGTSIAEYAGP